MKKLINLIILFLIFIVSLVFAGNYNYTDAMAKALMFFEANRCGKNVHIHNRFNWRGPCHIYDGIDVGEDLEGGYHDAGDHVIFGMPQTYAFSTLGWAYYETKNVYERTNQKIWMLRTLKYFSDFFMKCHRNPDVFYYQKGDGVIDHNYWGPPEMQGYQDYKIGRATKHKASPDEPAGDVAANAAAGMALMYLNYKDVDYNYAVDCLTHSITLYRLARKYEGLGTGDGFYTHDTFEDDMSFAGMWLARAAKDYGDQKMKQDFGDLLNTVFGFDVKNSTLSVYQLFLNDAKMYLDRKKGTNDPDDFQYEPFWPYCWANIFMGSVLLYGLEVDPVLKSQGKRNPYLEQIRKVIGNYAAGTSYFQKTPGGLIYPNTWGVLRYVSAAMFCFSVYLKYNPDEPNYQTWLNFIKSQIDYILGDNPRITIDVDHTNGFYNPGSYLVGWGQNPPKHPHHRAAHGSSTNNMNEPRYHRHILYGALVGGPDSTDTHNDVTTDYVLNEVAIDYNASAVAGLSMAAYFFGQNQMPEPDPEPEPHPGDEVYVTAVMGQDSAQRSQPIVFLFNKCGYPPRFLKDLSYRYFVDISELKQATTPYSENNVKIEVAYNPVSSSTISQSLIPYDPSRNLYYVEVNYPVDLPFYISVPILSPYAPFQFALVFQSPNWEEIWDSRNDYSRIGIPNGNGYEDSVKTYRIPVYQKGVLIYGSEPGKVIDTNDQPPLIYFKKPYPNTTLSGKIYLEGQTVDDKGIEKFVFYVHDPQTMQILWVSTQTQYVQANTTATFTTFWDSDNFPNGTYLIRMVSYDTNGQTGVAFAQVNIDHESGQQQDLSYPVVKITFPQNNDVITTNFEVRANITDYNGVSYAELWLNNVFISSKTQGPFNWPVDISNYPEGSTITIKVVGYNVLGLSSSDEIKVYKITQQQQQSSTTQVFFEYPQDGDTVSGIVDIYIRILSSYTITDVKFYIDGILKYQTNISPYIYSWDTTLVTNTTHTITVEVYDNVGMSSKTITVNVLNLQEDQKPQIQIVNLTNGETITKDKNVIIKITDDKKLSVVQVKINNEIIYDLKNLTTSQLELNYLLKISSFENNKSYSLEVFAVDNSSQTSYLKYNFSVSTEIENEYGIRKIYFVSANNDGINDAISFSKNVELFTLYNKKGELIVEEKNIKLWQPKNLEPDFYIYKIKLENKWYKGIVVVLK